MEFTICSVHLENCIALSHQSSRMLYISKSLLLHTNYSNDNFSQSLVCDDTHLQMHSILTALQESAYTKFSGKLLSVHPKTRECVHLYYTSELIKLDTQIIRNTKVFHIEMQTDISHFLKQFEYRTGQLVTVQGTQYCAFPQSEFSISSKIKEHLSFNGIVVNHNVVFKEKQQTHRSILIPRTLLPNNFHILLIDDSEVCVKALTQMLHSLGHYNIDACHCGSDAMKKLCNKLYQIVFIDIQLPDMNGEDIAKYLHETSPTSKKIGYTASVFSNKYFDECVSKPILMTKLRDIFNSK